MKIQAHKLFDNKFGNQWFDEIDDHWEYQQFKADPNWRRGWISFDCCYYDLDGRKVYLGITSFDADIFRCFDPTSGEFLNIGYASIAHPQDAKFHRSLVKWERDGCLYGAIALLHDVDKYWEAPGGAIVRYNPETGEMKKIAVPLPHIYFQSICLDHSKGILYGQTLTPERMVRFNLNTYRSDDLGPIGSGIDYGQGENIELDDEGCAWCGWTVTRAWQNSAGEDRNRLCKFDPVQDRIIYYDGGLQRPDGKYGYAKVEGIFNLGGDHMYCSGANGSLFRLDTVSGNAHYLFTPITDRSSRLASLRLAADGAAYGIIGREGHCQVLRFDPRSEKYELLGAVSDGQDSAWQIHDLCISPEGVIYACENDNPRRSGYLWEIHL
jgi:hypothetical protein